MPYYNEVANNPLFIWDPRSAVSGARRQSLVQMIDWAPTLLDYFQQPIPADMQGQPLAKVIASDEPVRKARCLACLADMLMLPTDAMFICGPRSRGVSMTLRTTR